MVGPSAKPKEKQFVPHPDDESNVRAGLEEAERGDVLSDEESADDVRSLSDDDAPATRSASRSSRGAMCAARNGSRSCPAPCAGARSD